MIIKKILSGVLAATLIVASVPAVADAKATVTNYAVPVTFSEASDVNATISAYEESAKSEEYTVDMEAYYPKDAFVEKTTYSMSIVMNLFGVQGEEFFPCALGTSKITYSLNGENFTFGGVTNASDYLTMTPLGSYYYLKVSGLPVKLTQYAGGGISKFADIPDKVYAFPDITFSGKAAQASTLYLDNLIVKGTSSTAYSNTYSSDQTDVATIAIGNAEGANVDPVKFAAGSLKVAKEKVTVKAKKSIDLGAVADPAGKITFKSSNKKIATVDSKGVVKGKKKGKAKITITANGLKQVVTVTVK